MSQTRSLPAASTGSSELIAAEADYEALTVALMQTQRGRWFLTEHARRCREADHGDLRKALVRIEQVLAEPREPAGIAEIQERLGALTRIEQVLAEPREPAGIAEIQERLGALTRIEQALAEPREPAGIAEIQERLGALTRIEQALADYRDPPAMAELREGLGVLTRIEQVLAEPREPAGIAEIQERLGALTRIEEALAGPREASGIAELREQVAAFAQTLDGVRAEVAAQRPSEPDPAEHARAREREEEMLRLLHAQRERLDALADIWAQAPAVPPAVSRPASPASAERIADAASLPGDEGGEPAPIEAQPESAADKPPPIEAQPESAADEPPPIAAQLESAADEPGIGDPVTVDDLADHAEAAAEQAPMLFDTQMSTADLLSKTMIFGPPAEPSPATEEAAQAGPAADSVAVDWTSGASVEAPVDEPACAADTDPIVQAFAQPPAPMARRRVLAVAEAPTPAVDTDPIVKALAALAPAPTEPILRHREMAAPATHPDPIVRMFIDPDPAVAAVDESGGARHADATGASPLPERTGLPAWLVGPAMGEPQPVDGAQVNDAVGATDSSPSAAAFEAAQQADAVENVAAPEAPHPAAGDAETITAETLFPVPPTGENELEPEPEPEPAPDSNAETEPALLSIGEAQSFSSPSADVAARTDQSDIAELTLDLLQKALLSNPARAAEAASRAGPPDPAPGDSSATVPVTESELLAAIAALRRALGREENQSLDGAGMSELVILDDLPVRPPLPASQRAPDAAAQPPDPLAPVYALSEEERVALFS